MKSRKPPVPGTYMQSPRLMSDPQVQKWVERILGDADAQPSDLDEAQLAFVHQRVLQTRGDDFEPGLFQKKMIETCPILAAPDLTSAAEDLGHMFSLPEMQKFWAGWTLSNPQKGPTPRYAGAKAVMCSLAMTGTSAHLDTAHEQVSAQPALHAVFDHVEGKAVILPAYKSLGRLMKALSAGDTCRWQAMKANVELLKWLRANHPKGRRVGRKLLIDATAIPAWVVQQSAGSRDDPRFERREENLRARASEAGFRAYQHTSNGKENLDATANVPVGAKTTKAWRGYYLVAIVDQATGLPIVWMLFDAAIQETSGLVPLLSDLHRLWPDINAELIAGDSAWNTNEICRVLEVDYGIAPIFRLKPSELRKSTFLTLEDGESRDGSVAAITFDGKLVCDAHRQPIDYAGSEAPSRAGLRPGQSTKEGAHRLRGLCRHTGHKHTRPCGKLSLRMAANWHRLTRFPHHRYGNPERHATRLVMLVRLNQVEGLFNRLKSGLHLGGADATRTRVQDRATHEAIISLGLLSLTAIAVADQRIALEIEIEDDLAA